MSSAPSIANYTGRGQPSGPMDFNSALEQPVAFFNEDGQDQQMSLHAAVVRGENIAKALDGRVQTLNALKYKEPATFNSSKEAGDVFLEQYDRLCLLVATVTSAVEEFEAMKLRYNQELDKQITASYPVMCYKDALMFNQKFDDFAKTMTKNYLTGGTYTSYLADRVGVLKTNLGEIKV